MNIPSSSCIGRSLASLRERRGVPSAQVCRAALISRAELRAIETGHAQPSVGVLVRVAGALGTTLIDVVRSADSSGASPSGVGTPTLQEIARAIVDLPATVGSKVDAVHAAAVLHAMELAHGNQSAAARLLGMERKAFVRRLARAKRKGK